MVNELFKRTINFPGPVFLEETVSTNLYLQALCDRIRQENLTCVYTSFQSAGRGQRGNSWESEKGKNLLFSFVVYPSRLEAGRQFLLSQITALALKETLSQFADNIHIKWPNDIYWKDRKLCGTLIENDLTGTHISRSISGTGVNLNQERFASNAPNPVSLKQITGHTYCPKDMLLQILERTAHYFGLLETEQTGVLTTRYKQCLYRKDGLHKYKDKGGEFMASFKDIEPSGKLVLEDEDGAIRKYMFKEVEYVLPSPTLTGLNKNSNTTAP